MPSITAKTANCDHCGCPDADWHGDDLLCDGCWDGRLQAAADRAYDEWKDRRMEDGDE